MLAAAADSAAACKALLQGQATLELADALGRTALMFAAGNDACTALHTLLASGASVRAPLPPRAPRAARTCRPAAPQRHLASYVSTAHCPRSPRLFDRQPAWGTEEHVSLAGADFVALRIWRGDTRTRRAEGGIAGSISARELCRVTMAGR